MIQAVIEYFPIELHDSRRGANYEFLDHSNQRHMALKSEINKTSGIYIFYDSMARAVYVGKHKGTNMYGEMKNAFNRDRSHYQKMWGVKHTTQQRQFDPGKESLRKVVQISYGLFDLTKYFSVYAVDESHVGSIEALLIRAFANQLTNKRKESISLS